MFPRRSVFPLRCCTRWQNGSGETIGSHSSCGQPAFMKRESHDERNFVKKAVNWALRNIGKRNVPLNRAAIHAAEKIRQQGSPAARWIAADALRELKSAAVETRLRRKTA